MYALNKQLSPTLRCLIIEDSLVDQKIMKRAILGAQARAEVEVVDTLNAAQHALNTRQFSIILCDNNLPDGNGTEFAEALARDPRYRDTRIVIVSGWPSPFMWAKAKAAGLQIIDKNDQLMLRLRRVINRTRERCQQVGANPAA